MLLMTLSTIPFPLSHTTNQQQKENIVLLLCSTWTEGTPPASAAPLHAWLEDATQDFRVSKALLSKASSYIEYVLYIHIYYVYIYKI